MGEGSPFLNLDNVKIAIDNSKNKDGLEYGRTRITVSTVGVGIKKDNLSAIEWAAKELDVYLAWSLHSSIPKQRSKMMPINEKYPIESLIPQLKNTMRQQSYYFYRVDLFRGKLLQRSMPKN